MANEVRIIKQPWEVFTIGVNFSRNMETDESIIFSDSSVIVTVYSTGEDVTTDMVSGIFRVQGSNVLLVVLKGGDDGVKYKASLRAYISDTKKLEEDVVFVVRD